MHVKLLLRGILDSFTGDNASAKESVKSIFNEPAD